MKSRYLKHGVLFQVLQILLIIVILAPLNPDFVKAQTGQEPQLVTAARHFDDCSPAGDYRIEIYNVGSLGGEAFSQAVYSFPNVDFVNTSNGDIACEVTSYSAMYGTFTGGPNGTITFPTGNSESITTCLVMDGKAIECNFEMDLFDLGKSSFKWVYNIENPEAFAQGPAITSEYIYTTYGIRVEDSFGDDQWAQKSWSDHELTLLNDVLKELPPGFLSKISLKRIVRNAVKIAANGNPKPDVMGTYYPCDEKTDPDCNGSSSTIRIFDPAATPSYFPNDPDKEFKATILHEITHAFQYKDVNGAIAKNVFETPQVIDYITTIRPVKGEAAYITHSGWGWYVPPGEWQLWGAANSIPPTEYGKSDPMEDMAESVKMYVYNPAKLQSSSVERYNYIRDYIFGGVEYDNGKQK